MKRMFAAALLLLLLAMPALAVGIGGAGWWDDGYDGAMQTIGDSGLSLKVPEGWRMSYPDGDLSFDDPEGTIHLRIVAVEDNFYGYVERFMDGSEGNYIDSAAMALKEGRDWFVGAAAGRFEAYCAAPEGGTLGFLFTLPDTEADFVKARRIISSVTAW